MGLELDPIDGQTPLDEDEKDDLLSDSVTTRGQLDELEQQNIEEAIQWIYLHNFRAEVVLSEKFVKSIHKRMYGSVWKWAGKFRKTNKNMGVDKWEIPLELKKLLEDCQFWIVNSVYSHDEIALRFKHRLVSIHCFVNGNGRHSRLMADILVEKIFKQPLFTWGAKNLVQPGEARLKYLKALKDADRGDYESLLVFARS